MSHHTNVHQVAGCTLDAGAKIYAGRVDAIYNDVYKMLGGFGRTNKQEKGKGVFCHAIYTYSNITYSKFSFKTCL